MTAVEPVSVNKAAPAQSQRRRWTDGRLALVLFVATSLIYIALSRGVFLYGDDILMFQVTESIVERGTFAVTSPHHDGDVARAIPGQDGRSYAKYGIGQSLVAIPVYIATDLILEPLLPLPDVYDAFGNQRLGTILYGTALTTAIVSGGSVALLYLLARAIDYRRETAIALALLLAVATPLAHYAATFLSEPLTMLSLLVVIYGLVRAATSTQFGRTALLWLALSGFAAGLALASRIAIGLTLVAPGLWLLWLAWGWARRRWTDGLLACVAWGVPIALWLAGVGAYNYVRFGNVRETGYGGEASQFTEPFLTGLTGLLVSPGKGLLWYCLPLLLALAGSVRFARRRPDLALVIAGMFVATVLLYSRYYIWYGGGVWGPRFLLPLLPLLLLPAGEVLERLWSATTRSRPLTVSVVAIVAASVWISAIGILVPFDDYVMDYNASPKLHDDALWEPADSPIIVHTERLFTADNDGPDIAAIRYRSYRLGAISVMTGAIGLALLGWSLLGVREPFSRGRTPSA